MKIGVVGFSSDAIDTVEARRLLELSFTQIIGSRPPNTVEIVTGLTNIGVPKIAYQIADAQGYTKVGISAQQAYHVKCGVYKVHQAIIVGQKFGDESETFIDYIDYLVGVGGGTQSRREIALFTEKCARKQWPVSERLATHPLELLSSH